MDLTHFLAMTSAEFTRCEEFPPHIAWMACHYSPYGTGLSNLPRELPQGSMLILNDRIPICGHDPKRVAEELAAAAAEHQCESILLDLQREDCPENTAVVENVLSRAEVPVGVSHLYAKDFTCPVFLPPPELDVPLKMHLAPWDGREIWLEAALDTTQLTVTEKGCTPLPLPYAPPEDGSFRDENLCCHYKAEIRDQAAVFTLWRTPEDLAALLDRAAALGISRTVGLYQQLKGSPLE